MSDNNTLTTILLATFSDDANVRNRATQALKNVEETDFPSYIGSLCAELGNDSKPQNSRQLAGLLLKNTLVAKSEAQQRINTRRWESVDNNIKDKIRQMLLQILANNEKAVRSTAAIAIAKIAAIDLPKGNWSNLIDILVNNITNMSNAVPLRASSFEALGYVCEEIPEGLESASNKVLNAIATGMRKEEENNEIKLAATKALANSLEFARNNFADPKERELIMRMVFSVTQSTDEHIRTAAYMCLVEIANSYYSIIKDYMQTIFALTTKAISQDREEVALQAVEFWSTMCDQEISIELEKEDAEHNKQSLDSVRQNLNIIPNAAQSLLKVLLPCLTKQSESLNDDTFNVAQAAGTCIGLMAQTAKDAIVPFVLQFVQQYINNNNWRFKEAAILAFGCILDGPNPNKLSPLVQQAFKVLLANMKDTHPLVKDTAAWTIGRICDLVPDAVIPCLDELMITLVQGLQDQNPKVASNVCWAIHNLASAVEINKDKNTSALSKYFGGVMTALFATTERQDGDQANLISSAYEAINVLINTAAPDTYDTIQKILPPLLGKLAQTVPKQGSNSNSDREKVNLVQTLICGALQVIITKLDARFIQNNSDNLMGVLLKVLEARHNTVHEEVLFCIGAIADRIGKSFEKYIAHLKPFLLVGLSDSMAFKVCIVTVGVIGDIARALEGSFLMLGDDVMKLLLENLQNRNIERTVKPHIISCFGDIALAVGGHFDRYMIFVMRFLQGASQTKIDKNDPDADDIDYLINLREAVLEAYTGILQGLSADNKGPVFINTIPDNKGLQVIFDFIDLIAEDPYTNTNESVIKAAAGFLGDLATRIPADLISKWLNRSSVFTIINTCVEQFSSDDDDPIRETGLWAKTVVASVTAKR